MILARHLPLVLGAVLLAGCNATLAFKDDFTRDALGEPPNRNPPGAPTGDVVDYYDPAGSGPPGLLTIVDDEVLGSRALRIADVRGQIFFRLLNFRAVRFPGSDGDDYRVSWRGATDVDPAGADLLFWVTNATFDTIASIRFTASGDLLVETTATSGGDTINLGPVTDGKAHSLVWTFDRARGLQSIVLFQFDPTDDTRSANLDSGWIPVIDTVPLASDRIFLNTWHTRDLGSSGSYVIDSVRISSREASASP